MRQRVINKIKVPALLLALWSVLACGGTICHEYIALGGVWGSCDTLLFACNGCEAETLALSVGVRHSADYPYKDLWIEVEGMLRDSIVHRDTVCCSIFGDDGRINGTTAGMLYQSEFFVSELPTPLNGLRVRHIMSDSMLRGVHDVGIRLVLPGRHQYEGR